MAFNLQEGEYVYVCMCNAWGKDLWFRIPGWEKQCEFLWVNLLRCSMGTVSSGNKWFYYVFVLAKALVICQKLMAKEWQRWRKHRGYKKAMSMLVCVCSWVKEVRVGRECLFTHKEFLWGSGKEKAAFFPLNRIICPNYWWQPGISLNMSWGWEKKKKKSVETERIRSAS